MLPEKAIGPLHALGVPESGQEKLARQRTLAVLKVIASLSDKAGLSGSPEGSWHSGIHAYVRDEYAVVAVSRGVSPDAVKRIPQHVQNVELTPDDLRQATAALYEHHGQTPNERHAAGLPDDDSGIPIEADIGACLAYLDDVDPAVPEYKLEDYEGHRCTYSCGHEGWDASHRRENLWQPRRNGSPYVPYDPQGSDREDGRVKKYRNMLREEYHGRAATARAMARAQLEASASDEPEPSQDLTRRGEFYLSPREVQELRNQRRIALGISPVGEVRPREEIIDAAFEREQERQEQTQPELSRVPQPSTSRYLDAPPPAAALPGDQAEGNNSYTRETRVPASERYHPTEKPEDRPLPVLPVLPTPPMITE